MSHELVWKWAVTYSCIMAVLIATFWFGNVIGMWPEIITVHDCKTKVVSQVLVRNVTKIVQNRSVISCDCPVSTVEYVSVIDNPDYYCRKKPR